MSHQTYGSSSDPKSIPWDVPYKTPPAGQKSDFDHPDVSLRNTIIITSAVTLAAALLIFVLRLGTRIFLLRALGWDDYLCVVGTAIAIAFNAAALMRVQYGLGVSTWDIRLRYYLEHDLASFFYWFSVGTILRHLALMFLKLSILALYLRIIGNAQDIHYKTRMVVYLTMIFVIGYNFGLIGWLLSICDPVSKFFHYKQPGNCKLSGVWKELTGWSAINIFADFLIFILPLPMIFTLHMPLSQKIGVMFILTTGLFCCVATIVNMIISLRIIRQQSTEDPLQLWAIIEMNIAIICICLPALKQLMARSLPLITSHFSKSGSGSGEAEDSNRPKLRDFERRKSKMRSIYEMDQYKELHEMPYQPKEGMPEEGFMSADVRDKEISYPRYDDAHIAAPSIC